MTDLLPDGVQRLIFCDGAIYAQTVPGLLREPFSVIVGENAGSFARISAAELETLTFSATYRPELEPSDELLHLGTAGAIYVSALKDWSLVGRPTLQCAIANSAEPSQIDLKTSITLPPHKEPFFFRAYLAVHRGEGRLILDRKGINGYRELRNRSEVPFDSAYLGGRALHGYQLVELQMQPSPGASEVMLSIQFDRGTASGAERSGRWIRRFAKRIIGRGNQRTESAPYFFVGDPHISSACVDDEPRVGHSVEKSKTIPGDLVWSKAIIPACLHPGETSALRVKGEDFILRRGLVPKIELLEDHGHTIVMRASEEGLFTFMLDGNQAFNHHLNNGHVSIRLPTSYLTGGVSRLSVWDETGVQELFSTFIQTPKILTPFEVLQIESADPFPGQIAAQAEHRYQALKAQIRASEAPETLAQIAHALSVLEGGYKNVKLKPLAFSTHENPDVSVVVPVHNKFAVTYFGLCSLLLAHNAATFEVILVDDASTDETAEIENFVSGITVVRNTEPQRFIRACNTGVGKARGKYVVLLNNDVEVANGWLDQLIDAFGRFENVGIAGSKLLYPDGMLQDAGGIIWGSGNPWNYGNGQNPWEPRYCYARQADYLSGAALMTTRDIWNEVGGLSSYLEPMYFEDTDFAFKVREAGYTTWFVPSSIVYHYEGMTSGTDTSSGFKRFQEVNRPKFKRKWAAAYAGGRPEGQLPDLEKDRGISGRVLFIDHSIPRPDRDAGSYAAVAEIRLVQSLGYKVTFLPQNMAHLGSYTEELERMGVEVLYAPFYLSVAECLEARGSEFDAFYITRYHVAQNVLDLIERYAPGRKILLNNADLHFLRELRAGIAANDAGIIDTAKATRVAELSVMQRVDVVLSYNDTEHSVIASHTDGEVKVVHCPWVVDVPEYVPDIALRSGISFLGNYLHHPNAEGVHWFVREVIPLIECSTSDQIFFIYGSGMPDHIRELASGTVRPQGFVEEIADAFSHHRIFIAPLLSGAGIKGKVLAALAHGIPTVLSPLAAEGTGLRHGHDCLIAQTPQDWAKAIEDLQCDDALWHRISGNARAYVSCNYSFAKGRESMRAAFEAADMYPTRL